MAPTDHHDFLCEACGYLLNGLHIQDHCPECGQAIRRSHPDRRIGTHWQRTGAARPAITAVLRHPARTFQDAVPEIEQSRAFKHICLAAAGLLTAFTLLPILVMESAITTGGTGNLSEPALVILIANAGLFGMPVTLLLGFLTAIEKQGIRLFGRLHHRRIDNRVAETIVGHAAAAWSTLPALIAVGWVLGTFLRWLAKAHSWASWELTLTAPYWGPVAGAFLAMLWFEVVVWSGVRRMRFANPPEAAARLQN